MIRIETNLPDVTRQLQELAQRKLPRATLNAVNDLAFDVRTAMQDEMRRVLDRPTQFALRMLEVKKGNDVSRPESEVLVTGDNRKDTTFRHLYTGGERSQKRMERRLIAAGLMRPGRIAVPGAAAPLDRYGNLRGSFVTLLLSYFQALEMGNMTAAGRAKRARKIKLKTGMKIRGVEYFISHGRGDRGRGHGLIDIQHLPEGIWSRSGTGGGVIKPVLMFVKPGSYRRYLDLEGVADETIRTQYETRLVDRLSRAIVGALGDRSS